MNALSQRQSPVFSLWNRVSHLPGSRFFFSRLLDSLVPYASSISPTIEQLEPGHVRLSMENRRAVRNHVGSTHAAALMNLAETTGGLAVSSLLPKGSHAIVKSATVDYRRKAHGPLTAECRLRGYDIERPAQQPVEVLVRDRQGRIVAEVELVFRLQAQTKLAA